MRQIVIAAAVSCASACGQTATATDVFTKAPPEIDEALRERIAGFYQKHVEGKFRAAEQYVAADSLDLFYEADKARYISFEIVKIEYSDNFTKALVVTAVEIDWRTARMGVMRVKPPITTSWKLDDGKWSWFTVPRKDWDSPWGKMNPGSTDANNPAGAMVAAFKGVTAESIQARVLLSKQIVELSSFEKSKDTVEVTNGMDGDISLRLDSVSMPGLSVASDTKVLKGGQVARLTFTYDPPVKEAKPATTATLYIEPTGQTMPMRIQFALSKEMQEQLKKANIK